MSIQLFNYEIDRIHIIQNPVITTCCGMTACMKCVIEKIMSQENKGICCFCSKPIDVKNEGLENCAKLIPNKPMRKLLAKHIDRDLSNLTKEERQ